MHTAGQRRRKTVLLTVALGPSGAMPQLIYLMLQLDFFFFHQHPNLLQLCGCWTVHKPVTSRHPGYMKMEESLGTFILAPTVSYLPSLSWPRLQTALTQLGLT